MRTPLSIIGIIAIALSAHVRAAEPEGKILKETWDAIYVDGNQVGHGHGLYKEIQTKIGPIIEASTVLEMTLARFGQTLQINITYANHETPDGNVLALVVRQGIGKTQSIVRRGKVQDGKLTLKIKVGDKDAPDAVIPWSDNILGLFAEERLYEKRERKPNTQFDYHRFMPDFNTVLATHASIKDYEEVDLLDNKKEKLLRIETGIDPIQGVELPSETLWVNDKGEPVKRQMTMPAIGDVVMYRTTKEHALTRSYGTAKDVGIDQLIKLERGLVRPDDTRQVIYRIRLKGLSEPEKAIADDDRQTIRNVKGEEFELIVNGLDRPQATRNPGQEKPEEYLKSNHFIRSDDERVRRYARMAVGRERDVWRQALRIERWVNQNLRSKNYTEAFATADEVARTLQGDCSEHSVLAAAMCRAVGIPSRTAIGLVYVPRQRAMGYHMWIEVWVNGKWYPLDPTMGKGEVAASHIKISDHHWNDVQSFTPLLPLMRVLGRMEIELVSAQHDRR